MKTIASLEVGHTGELLERLRKEAIPTNIHVITIESGLEMTEIMVQDAYYERGCAVVQAWHAEQLAKSKKRSGVSCPKCGSRNYDRISDARNRETYKCKDCGYQFAGE